MKHMEKAQPKQKQEGSALVITLLLLMGLTATGAVFMTASRTDMQIIDGSLLVTGQFTWYGLISTLGDVNFAGGGSGIHVYGGILSEGQVTRNDISGEADVLYCSLMLKKLEELGRYVVLSWNER